MERDEAIITFAELVTDGMAMCEPALERDWDDARFWWRLIAKSAEKA